MPHTSRVAKEGLEQRRLAKGVVGRALCAVIGVAVVTHACGLPVGRWPTVRSGIFSRGAGGDGSAASKVGSSAMERWLTAVDEPPN